MPLAETIGHSAPSGERPVACGGVFLAPFFGQPFPPAHGKGTPSLVYAFSVRGGSRCSDRLEGAPQVSKISFQRRRRSVPRTGALALLVVLALSHHRRVARRVSQKACKTVGLRPRPLSGPAPASIPVRPSGTRPIAQPSNQFRQVKQLTLLGWVLHLPQRLAWACVLFQKQHPLARLPTYPTHTKVALESFPPQRPLRRTPVPALNAATLVENPPVSRVRPSGLFPFSEFVFQRVRQPQQTPLAICAERARQPCPRAIDINRLCLCCAVSATPIHVPSSCPPNTTKIRRFRPPGQFLERDDHLHPRRLSLGRTKKSHPTRPYRAEGTTWPSLAWLGNFIRGKWR